MPRPTPRFGQGCRQKPQRSGFVTRTAAPTPACRSRTTESQVPGRAGRQYSLSRKQPRWRYWWTDCAANTVAHCRARLPYRGTRSLASDDDTSTSYPEWTPQSIICLHRHRREICRAARSAAWCHAELNRAPKPSETSRTIWAALSSAAEGVLQPQRRRCSRYLPGQYRGLSRHYQASAERCSGYGKRRY